ncbi:MAG: hypothetical protein HC867_05155 [Bacteroidia bacterium]|nr:hypothetical protein [Bacteroidia bacterium]
MKVTLVPAHMVLLGLAEIVTDGTRTGLTVMVTVFDVTEAGTGQGTEEVISQVIISPLARELF